MLGIDLVDPSSCDTVLLTSPRPGGNVVMGESSAVDWSSARIRSDDSIMSATAPTSPADCSAPPGVGNRLSAVSIVVSDASATEAASSRSPVVESTSATTARKTDKDSATTSNHSSSATMKLTASDRGASKSMSKITASLGDKKSFLKRSKSEAIQNKDHKTKKNKQRNSQLEKFDRVFGDMNETLINSYHCALLGDIMIQGILYVTEHWLLFYSKLLGKKSIKIAVSEIVEISKKKTAGLIPNAICIETGSKKYIFGSLMTRDSTFAVLHDVWKGLHSAEAAADTADRSAENISVRSAAEQGQTPDNSSDNESNTSVISSDQESAINATSNCSEVFYTDSPLLEGDPPPSSTSSASTRRVDPPQPIVFNATRDPSADDVMDGSTNVPKRSRDQYDTSKPTQRQQTIGIRLASAASGRSTNVRSACVLLLVISFTLALVLTFATVVLVYKIVRLQMIVEHGLIEHAATSYASARTKSQTNTMSQLEELLESHKQLLQQVNQSLNGLTEMTRGVCSSLQKPQT